ncbi:MAG: hypothetical protein ACXV5D_07360 [Halobacteriota archaeon]
MVNVVTIRSQNGAYMKVKAAEFRTDPRSGTSIVQPVTTAVVV